MKFKESSYKDEFQKLPQALREIAAYMDEWLKYKGKDLIITRVGETISGESGVHQCSRAFDARIETRNDFYIPLSTAYMLRDDVNSKYPRKTDKFQVCVVHSYNGGLYHFHVQIPASWLDYKKVPKGGNENGKVSSEE